MQIEEEMAIPFFLYFCFSAYMLEVRTVIILGFMYYYKL